MKALFFPLLAKKYDPYAIDAGIFAMYVAGARCVPIACSHMIADDGYGLATVNGQPVSAGKCYKFDFSPLPMYLLPVGEAATEFDKTYTIQLSGYKAENGKAFRTTTFRLKTAGRHVDDGRHQENELAAKAVSDEGIVLLQNDGALPLQDGTPVALLGEYQNFRISAVGAGAIKPRWTLSIREAIEASGRLSISGDAQTALFFLSRSSGEGKDNRPCPGGYYLTQEEKSALSAAVARCKTVILILNTGYPIEMGFIRSAGVQAILWTGFPGQRGSESLVDILTGRVNPSGKLADTWPLDYYDAPSAKNFIHLDEDAPPYTDDGKKHGAAVYYEEEQFIGYRYFDSFDKPTAFCFGHGLSYTKFIISGTASFENMTLTVRATVKNTEGPKGKQALQVYVESPKGDLMKPRRTLAGFAKSALLCEGESQQLVIEIPVKDFSVYDPARTAFVLEAGAYTVWLGESLGTALSIGAFTLDETAEIEKTVSVCIPLEEVGSIGGDGSAKAKSRITAAQDCIATRAIPQYTAHEALPPYLGKTIRLADVRNDPRLLESFVAQMSLRELIAFSVCNGSCWKPWLSGAAGKLASSKRLGIPTLYMSDGNSGVNLNRQTTGFPASNLLVGTFNTALAHMVGRVIAAESKEYGIAINLGPGANLHRNILCGRHPEYFSEDPIVAGTMMAFQAMGLEESGVPATYKHLFANNMEFERKAAHSVIGERSLRELYLRVFDKAFSLYKPCCVMTAYNPVNGIYPSENPELLETLLRTCWGFEGFVMTDWSSYDTMDSIRSLRAGTSLLTPGSKRYRRLLRRAIHVGSINKAVLQYNVQQIMKVLAKCI